MGSASWPFGAVGVVGDVGAGVGGDAILVDDPIEGGAVAEAVAKGGGWDAPEGEGFVVAEVGFVFAEGHLFYAEGPGLVGLFDFFEGVFGLLLVVDVEFHEAFRCLATNGRFLEVVPALLGQRGLHRRNPYAAYRRSDTNRTYHPPTTFHIRQSSGSA